MSVLWGNSQLVVKVAILQTPVKLYHDDEIKVWLSVTLNAWVRCAFGNAWTKSTMASGTIPSQDCKSHKFPLAFIIYRCVFRFVYIQSEFKQEKKTNGKTRNFFNFNKISQFWPNFIILIHFQKSLSVCSGDVLFILLNTFLSWCWCRPFLLELFPECHSCGCCQLEEERNMQPQQPARGLSFPKLPKKRNKEEQMRERKAKWIKSFGIGCDQKI